MRDLSTYCGLAVAAILFLGSFGLPIPVPLFGVLIAAGVFAAQGKVNVVLLIALTASAAIFGDTLGYLSGYLGERWYRRRDTGPDGCVPEPPHGMRKPIAKALASRAVRRALAWSNERLARGGGMGALIVLTRIVFGAFGPVVNILCGVRRYPIGRFLLYDALGETVWAGVYIGIGFIAGAQGNDAKSVLTNPIMIGVMIALIVIPAVLTMRIGQPPGARPSPSLGEAGNDGAARVPIGQRIARGHPS